MNGITCPSCKADVESDLYESTGQTDCPYCGSDLSALLQINVAGSDEMGGYRTDVAPAANQIELPPLPAKSKIEIVQSSPGRLVLHIPPGGKHAAGIGCFTIMWNGIMGVVSATFLVGAAQAKVAWVVIPFLSLFWLIGLGLAYWWIRSRFMRLFILLDANQIALQRTLFGRKWINETHLNGDSSASLVESYSQNNVPVYRVEVSGSNRTAKFGTALSREEKNWLCDQINHFLRKDSADPSTDESQRFLARAIPIEDLNPAELPVESPILIQEAQTDRLQFTFPICSIKGGGWVAILFGLIFSSVWGFGTGNDILSHVGKHMDLFDVFVTLFLGLFFLVGMLPLLFVFAFLFSKTTVELTPEEFRCRWHSGPLGYQKIIPTQDITSIELKQPSSAETARRRRRTKNGKSANNRPSCIVNTATSTLPITFMTELETTRQIAGLLQYQLRQMGVLLANSED